MFSLVGLLISVGIVVWLGSMASDRGTDGPGRPSTRIEDETIDGPAGSVVTVPAALAVDVSPSAGLKGGAEVVVTSNAFAAGEVVAIRMCVAGADRVVGGDGCDATTTTKVFVNAERHLQANYRVRRVVTAGGLPFDCLTEAHRCTVRVAIDADPSQGGTVALTFAPDPDLPEISMPG
ncbi:MAG: hypothetical protein JWM47_207 [Acidimicrobiales bacterium]|nr:hypothetical protein [Acidimicrobiales bacterium]